MTRSTQRFCATSGFIMVALFLGGFVLSGFIVPPSPRLGPGEIAALFQENRTRIQIGMILCMFGSALLVPWSVVLYLLTRTGAGARSPMPLVQLVSGGIFSLEFLYLIMFWQTAAYRSDGQTSPEIIRILNDMAWIPFVGLTSTAVLQAGALGVSMLSDSRETPTFPRWMGYGNVWAGLIFTTGTVCVFFQSGPFAWNGAICWYLPLTVFSIWMPINSVFALRAIRRSTDVTSEAGSAADIDLLADEVEAIRARLAQLAAAQTR